MFAFFKEKLYKECNHLKSEIASDNMFNAWVTISLVDFVNSWMMSQTNVMEIYPDKDKCALNKF